ncbi:MAG TPA: 3-oxoadipate enol-lactonase [Burkholderiaceae bacterium]|nr:3-oxoadipate enol-lactonase [Burkholderiaceae bacterium]
MPFIERAQARLYWRSDGDPANPPLVLVNSLGSDHALWEPILPYLVRSFRVIRADKRGHGASSTSPGDYDIEMLAQDVLAVADAAGAQRFAYLGVSIGGMIGLWLGANAPQRIERMVLCNTAVRPGAPEVMAERVRKVRAEGMAAVADGVLARFFTQRFIERGSPHLHSVRSTLLSLDPQGYAACAAAVRDADLSALPPKVRVPTLVIVGSHDQSMPPALGRALAAGIDGAALIEIDCAHISHSEDPPRFIDAVWPFLTGPAPLSVQGRFDRGLARRKQVLGADYVEQRMASSDPFTHDFQQLITRYAWDEIWTRPVLDDRTRRLIVLAITVATGRWEEFRLHGRAGLQAELSPTELKELLIQCAIYAGVPAANTGFHHAVELLHQHAAEDGARG